ADGAAVDLEFADDGVAARGVECECAAFDLSRASEGDALGGGSGVAHFARGGLAQSRRPVTADAAGEEEPAPPVDRDLGIALDDDVAAVEAIGGPRGQRQGTGGRTAAEGPVAVEEQWLEDRVIAVQIDRGAVEYASSRDRGAEAQAVSE